MKEIEDMRVFLEKELGQLKAGQVHSDLIQQKLGEIEDQVKLLLERVPCFLKFYVTINRVQACFHSFVHLYLVTLITVIHQVSFRLPNLCITKKTSRRIQDEINSCYCVVLTVKIASLIAQRPVI